jgi:aminoglycoside phosphotransferase
MAGPADPEGISLSDPTVPIDPEQAARALGRALAVKHTTAPSVDGRVDLAVFAAAVRADAEASDDATFDAGPYLDRSRHEMARLAVETVAALPATDTAEVAITPGFDLGMVQLQRDGSVIVLGDTVAGDRHLDLARAAVALALRFGPAVVAPFLDAYGLDDIDVRRLDTCQLLGSVAEEVGVAEPVDAP